MRTEMCRTLAVVLWAFCLIPQAPTAEQEDSVVKFLRTYVGDPNAGDTGLTRYFVGFADLRDDGTKDAIVYFLDDGWCGSSGCRTLILVPQRGAGPLPTSG